MWQHFLCLVFLLLNCTAWLNSSSNGVCDDAFSCNGSTVTNGKALCSGFQSCSNSNMIGMYYADCIGEQSCFGSKIVSNKSESNESPTISCSASESCRFSVLTCPFLDCYGENSCGNSKISSIFNKEKNGAVTSESQLICHGWNSCSNCIVDMTHTLFCESSYACNNISVTSPSLDMVCSGEFGCNDAKIVGNGTIKCQGYYSCSAMQIDISQVLNYNSLTIVGDGYNDLNGATIRVNGEDSRLNVTLSGYASGSYANIFCGLGSKCFINCQSSNACQGLTLYCDVMSNCTVICDENATDTCGYQCPTIYTMNKLPSISSMKKPIKDVISDELSTKDMVLYKSSDYDSNNIYCDKSFEDSECFESKFSSSKNVYCRGSNACYLSDISANGNISCESFQACAGGEIDSGANIVCSGESSCGYQCSINATGNIDCAGQQSCDSALVLASKSGNILCNGFGSCSSIPFMLANDFITCNGVVSCLNSIMMISLNSNDPNSYSRVISCVGYESCIGSQIISAKSVICQGDASCVGTIMTNVSYVYGYGHSSLAGSVIKSLNSGHLTVKFMGGYAGASSYYASVTQIYCQELAICDIYCESDAACAKVELYCGSQIENHCNVYCPSAAQNCTDYYCPTFESF